MQECQILFDDPPELLRFDPCGHTIGVEAFVSNVTQLSEGGTGRGRLVGSQLSGHYAFECPLGCPGSLVHDIHHYKVCGRDVYDRMKSWAVDEQFGPDEPAQAAVDADAPAPPGVEHDPQEEIIAAINAALTEAVAVICPSCHVAGQKDGACCHMMCPSCQATYCYFCGNLQVECSQNDGCPLYLTGHALPTGTVLSADRFLAVQQYHVARALRLLNGIMADVGREAFEEAVGRQPHMLRGIAAHDGMGADNDRQHAPVPGIDITLDEIDAYEPLPGMP